MTIQWISKQRTGCCKFFSERGWKLKVLWKVLEFEKNLTIDKFSSPGDQGDESFLHRKDYIYYEEYEIDDDEDPDANDDDDGIPLTLE